MPSVLKPVLLLDASPTAALTASPTTVDFTATCPMNLVDCHAIATATQAAGTAQFQRQALGAGAFNAMTTAALAMDTVSALIRTTTIVAAERVIAATDVVRANFVTVGANGHVYGHMEMVGITGN
jgi:hypothetical protein